MKKIVWGLLLIGLLVYPLGGQPARAQILVGDPVDPTSGLVVKLDTGVTLADFLALNGLEASQVKEGRDGYLLVQPGAQIATAGEPMMVNGVLSVTWDSQAQIMETKPNDKYYLSDQWDMQRIGMEKVWDNYTGSKKIVVAVLDTGLNYNHEDLQNIMWVNSKEIANNSKDDDNNGYVDDMNGYNFVDKSPVVLDDNGHGSAVSSIIGANSNNKIGIAGEEWQATIMPVKVASSSGSASLFDIAQGIYYATDNGAQVINMSLGTSVDQTYVHDAVKYAYNHGVFMVAASGNSKTDSSKVAYPYFPAAYDEVMAVGASTPDDEAANLSNSTFISHYGKKLELLAPGVDILAAAKDNKGYNSYNGTSLATPHVAGAAALMLSKNSSLTPAQIRQILDDTARKVSAMSGNFDEKYGYGILDVAAAMAKVEKSDDDTHVYGSNYQALLVGQSNDWYMRPGDKRQMWVEYKNIGDAKWQLAGTNAVHLATTGPNDRVSNFYETGSWLTANRVANGEIVTVKPGEKVRFSFDVTAPTQTGEYKESFALVVEGLQWLKNTTVSWNLPVTNQSVNSAVWLTQSDYLSMNRGQLANCWVEYLNNGTTTWQRQGATAVHLGTSHSQDRESLFYDKTSWLTNNRISLDQDQVLPGEVGKFSFSVKALVPGTFNEYFQPVMENVQWLPDYGVFWQFTVNK
jgi:subtilisin family serine protease